MATTPAEAGQDEFQCARCLDEQMITHPERNRARLVVDQRRSRP
jgi:hypothetical protein